MSVESWRWYNPAIHVARHALRDVDEHFGAASDGGVSGVYNDYNVELAACFFARPGLVDAYTCKCKVVRLLAEPGKV